MARQAKSGGIVANTYWTEGEARAVIDAWDESGQTGCAFARLIGVSAQRLSWWRRRLAATDTPAFLPVVTTTTTSSSRAPASAALVVVTSAGVRIEVCDVDASTAAWVVAVLRGGTAT